MLKRWEDLPDFMRTPEVRPYWEVLYKKRGQLMLKRAFDLTAALVLLVVLSAPMVVIAGMIKLDSPGSVFYRQERVTTYGKHFRIHKFRTMVSNADKIGSTVTVGNDSRITRVGAKLRNLRLDELPQVLDVITGDMSFVGTRPEAVKYVEQYKPEYNATLLMPAGITSETSILYKDEGTLLNEVDNVDDIYVEKVLPGKMYHNLNGIEQFSVGGDIRIMFMTVFAVLGKKYVPNKAGEDAFANKPKYNQGDYAMQIRSIYNSEKGINEIINNIVSIHLDAFQGFFLTFMGGDFLALMYRSYVEHNNSGVLVAFENEKPIGFLAYSGDLSDLYKYMIKKRFIPFAWCSFRAFFRKPTIFMRLIRALLKPREAKRAEKYVELASIGVASNTKSRGVGSQLIDALKSTVDFNEYSYITLETDAVNNDGVNHFYQKNGFVVEREYETTEGRKMFEYRLNRNQEEVTNEKDTVC